MNDLTTDDNLLTDDSPTAKDLAGQFVRPSYSFKGEDLRPFTAGTDLLFNQVLDRNDASMTCILSFVFVHRQKIARDELLNLCWDKTKFRGALIDWIDSLGELTLQDKRDATALFEEMRGWARKSSVEIVPDAAEKKTKASRRRK
jgi:hypothetical protein